MAYLFQPPEPASLRIMGSADLFPLHRIYCVGRNYAAHAREMGNDEKDPPFFFMKPADAIVPEGGDVPYPPATSDLHHEIELAVALGSGGANIPADAALDHVYGYAVALDLTRRDLQGEAKKQGRPWDVGKGFDHSAPCSAIRPASEIGHPAKGRITLTVNGETRQDGDLDEMIWNVSDTIAFLSGLFELKPGDLILTGTPAGVGAVVQGDRLHGTVEDVGKLDVRLV